MRAGISRVVVEIIILVIAVALALLIFSPISGYIFGSLGRTATVGGTTQIQVLNAQITGTTTSGGTTTATWIIDVKNLGPGTPSYLGSSISTNDFKVFVDQQECTISVTPTESGGNDQAKWEVNEVIEIKCTSSVIDKSKQHSIVVYGPGNTQTQYLYYPPPS